MTTDSSSNDRAGTVPGGSADRPSEIPPRGWLQVAKRGWQESTTDQVPMLAAGVAFFGFLALFPAMVAFTLVWGLLADPATVTQQTAALTASLPAEARTLLVDQLQQLASASDQSLGWGLVVAVLAALWSASGGIGNLMAAINIAYDEERRRSFVKDKLIALALTLGAIVFMVLMVALVAGVPAALQLIGIGEGWRWLAEVLRWLLIAALVMAALAVLYRVAPNRDAPKFRWVSIGAVLATLLWLLASAGFSVYVSLFGNYAKTYGALAGVAVLMLWLWITCYAILLGAEINAEAEAQTIRDTTRGPDQPLGSRGAVKADSVPPGMDEAPPDHGGGTDSHGGRTDSTGTDEHTR
jgi:membrane protein